MTTAVAPIRRSIAVSLLVVLSAACGATPPTPAPQASLLPTSGPATAAPATLMPTAPPESPSATASTTASPAPTPSPLATPTQSEGTVTIVLAATDGSNVSGFLTATDIGDDTTTLAATLDSTGLHPWALYPNFDCAGLPVEDSQLPIALPDIENGASTETVESSAFTQSLAAVVFEAPEADTIACGILAPLPWAEAAPPTTEPTADPSVPTAISALVEQMEAAVRDGDSAAYLALVDVTDPVFAVEHTRFAEDWAANPPSAYTLEVSDAAIGGDEATGVLTTTWDAAGIGERAAPLPVRFTLGADGAWRYAGEVWVTREVEHFRIHVAPGLEDELDPIAESLPDVFDHVTQSLDHEPDGVMEIKLYEGPAQLVSTVRLGLPDIHGWNEPGESLKMRLDPEVPSLTPTIAHEFGHFVEFDRAGTQRSRMPWWLSEGVASFLGYHFEGPEPGEFQLQRVRDWAAQDALADWEDMAVFEETPMELWPNVYAQGYVFTAFVTETYGVEARNAWLAAMATEMDISAATSAHLDMTFEELEQEFLGWL